MLLGIWTSSSSSSHANVSVFTEIGKLVIFGMADDDGFTTHISKSKKKAIRNEVLRKFLLSDELKNVCVLHLMGKCRRGTDCSFDHVDLRETLYAFTKDLYYDFTHIEGIEFRRVDIIRFIIGFFGDERSINLTNCTFYQKGTMCQNEKHGRFIKFPMRFRDKSMVLHICYAENSRFTLCGMHIDYVIEETRTKFKVVDIISAPYVTGSGRHERIEGEKSAESVDFDSVNDFPELNSDRGSVSSEVSTASSFHGYSAAVKVQAFQRKAAPFKPKRKTSGVTEIISKIEAPVETAPVETATVETVPVETAPAASAAEPEVESGSSQSVAVKKKAKKKAKEAKKKAREAKKRAEAAAAAADEASVAQDSKKMMIETTAKVVVDKLLLSHLNADNFENLAEQIFLQKINPDETDAEKIVRLERENIILFKRNIELTDELQNLRMYENIDKNLDLSTEYLKRRYGDEIDLGYESEDSWYNEEEEYEELNAIPHFTSDVNLLS